MAVSSTSRVNKKKQKNPTPEIYFARNLAASDKKVRDRTIKKLKKWLAARSSVKDGLKDEELLRLWKGLFYCMWMSDKPLVQEELAETIASLIHELHERSIGLSFFKISLVTMAREWHGIDKWRMDKFLMFVRRLVRHGIMYVAQGGWNGKETEELSTIFSQQIINANHSVVGVQVPLGLQLHVIDLFLEELAKVGGTDLESATILELLMPFVTCLAKTSDGRVKDSVRKRIFYHLMRQSDLGIAYENRGNDSESGDEEEDEIPDADDDVNEGEEPSDQEDDTSTEKDPRAGGVNVVLPQLRPNYTELADKIFNAASESTVRVKNRKFMYNLVTKFRDLENGVYPLAVDVDTEIFPGLTREDIEAAIQKEVEEKLKEAEENQAEKRKRRKEVKTERNKRKKVERKIEEEYVDDDDEEDEDMMEDEEDDIGDDEEFDGDMDTEDLDLLGDEDVDEEGLDEETGEEDVEGDGGEDFMDEEEEDDEEESEEVKPILKKSKQHQLSLKNKIGKIAKKTLPQFDIDDNWDEESDSEIQPTQAEPKAKNTKAKKKAWNETPVEGEVEIVIPNKKYKGPLKMETQKPKADTKPATNSDRGRKVNFTLERNKFQEHAEYQESVRKSPGVPHDPQKKPSFGVLKRNSARAAKSKNLKF